jgi:hypothetical protein
MGIFLRTLLFTAPVFFFFSPVSLIEASTKNLHCGNHNDPLIITHEPFSPNETVLPGLNDAKKIFVFSTFYEIAGSGIR